MKRLLATIIAALLCCGAFADQKRAERLFDAGNTAYVNGDYITAIECYDSIVNMGLQSAKLYYNMGGACFKAGRIGQAVLCYNKALRLAPASDDIAHNLAVVGTFTRDNNIAPLPEFFLSRWITALRRSLSGNVWAALSLAFFALLLSGVLVWLLPLSHAWRRAGVAAAAVSVALFVLCTVFACIDRRQWLNPSEAVVMSTAASVKSSPDASGRELFVLHEGTKVTVTDALGDWREVTIADGNRGWLPVAAIEMID